MAQDLSDLIAAREWVWDSVLRADWGEQAQSLISAGPSLSDTNMHVPLPEDNAALVVPSREIVIVSPRPATPREPVVAPPELPQTADFMISQILPGSVEDLDEEPSVDEAAPATL